MSNYLKFVEVLGLSESKNFTVDNMKGQRLGWINFYPKWQKYVFTPYSEAIFDSECLEGIIYFMKGLK